MTGQDIAQTLKDFGNREPTEEELWDFIRRTRDSMLKGTDWVVTKAGELNEPVPSNYVTYRAKLRDIPQDYKLPEDVVFPKL